VATVYPAGRDLPIEPEVTGQALVDALQRCPFADKYPLVAPAEPMKISKPVEI
jgi:hypothetical protein